MLRYAVIGSGAVGCFYGIRLAHAGARVQFLVRRDAAEARRHGWDLLSPEGDIHLAPVEVAADWSELAPCDVLLVAVKATANDDVLALLAEHADRLLAPDGAVLVVQNGMGAEPRYAQAAPGRVVLGGLAFLCAQRRDARTVEHLDFGALTIAAHAPAGPAGILPVMGAIAEDLARANTEAHLEVDLDRARWRKLMWNIPFNPLSVILGATTDELMADPMAVQLVRSLMSEVEQAARAEGHALPEDLAGDLLDATARMAPYSTSMRLDADAGRPMEVDAMLGEPLRRAARAGVAMPGVAVLHRQLSFLDRRRGQRRSHPPRHG